MGNTKPHIYEVKTMDGFSQLNKHIFWSYIHYIYYILIKPKRIKYDFKLRFISMQLMNSSYFHDLHLDSNDQTSTL